MKVYKINVVTDHLISKKIIRPKIDSMQMNSYLNDEIPY